MQNSLHSHAGAKTADVCRKHGISSATFYKFKAKFGGMADAGQRDPEGCRREKMVTPDAKRKAVVHACKVHGVALIDVHWHDRVSITCAAVNSAVHVNASPDRLMRPRTSVSPD